MVLFKILNINNINDITMKKMKLYISLLLGIFIVNSCELDNLKGPNAQIYGGIYDNVTNELIPQDIISGSQIAYTELGYSVPTIQYMIFKTDGTYRNNLMFSGEYSIQPASGNFITPVLDTITLPKGETKLDFTAQPFLRITNCTIQKVGTTVVATFNVTQTTTDKVGYSALFAHKDITVGGSYYMVRQRVTINANIDPSTLQTITIDLAANSSTLKPGNSYYFRVGAISNAAGAKYNFAPMIIRIDV